MIPLTVPVLNREMKQSAVNALYNEHMVGGESVVKFEEEFAKYTGSDYAVSTNSGSSALLLAFNAIGTKQGEKIVAPSATFIATVNGACLQGARPLFCEIGSNYVILLEHLKKILDSNTIKCVIPVHLYGHPCDMPAIKELVKDKKTLIIEDAAQAHGAQIGKKRVGSFGDAAIFSFYPSKNMTVGGDGGMLTTNSKKISESVSKMRDVGRKTKYSHDKIGYTLRLNSVNAAIGRVQLRYLESWNEKRRKIATTYSNQLKHIAEMILPPSDNKTTKSVYHMFVIRSKKRNLLGTWLAKNGISTGIHYPIPAHRQPAYSKISKISLPFTDEWSKTVISIPMHVNLNPTDQKFIISMIEKFYDERIYDNSELQDEAKLWSAKLT